MSRIFVLSAWVSVTCMVGPGTPAATLATTSTTSTTAELPSKQTAPRSARRRGAIPCRVLGTVTPPRGSDARRVVARSTSERWTDSARESGGEVAPPAMSRDDALARGGIVRGEVVEVALEPEQNPWLYRFDREGRAHEARLASSIVDGHAYDYAFTYACVSVATASRSHTAAGPTVVLRTSSPSSGPRAGERTSVLVADGSVDLVVDEVAARDETTPAGARTRAVLSVAEHRMPVSATPERGRPATELAIVHPADPRARLVDPTDGADLPIDADRIRFLVDLDGDGEPDVLLARERSGCAIELRRQPEGWREADRDCA